MKLYDEKTETYLTNFNEKNIACRPQNLLLVFLFFTIILIAIDSY